MKLVVNYDLVDKALEARTGFSLRYNVGIISFTNGLAIPAILLGAKLGNADPIDTFKTIMHLFGYSLTFNGFRSFCYSFFNRQQAIQTLTELSAKLNDICVETDSELLKNAYQYKVEYDINFESFPPKIEQKKYIMVPVNNDWGNNERSLVQEHVVGSREFILSYGEPEKEKVYSFGTRKMISK